MGSIAFYHPYYSLPIPAVGGGAVEELQEILIDENEKNVKKDFLIFQPQPSEENLKKIEQYDYKKTKLVFLKGGHKVNIIVRIINKLMKVLHIKKRISYLTAYDKEFIKRLRDYDIDRIVFEGNCPEKLAKKLSKMYGREKLFLHLHSNYPITKSIVNNIGGLIGVSQFVLDEWREYKKYNKCLAQNYHLLLNCVRDDKFSRLATQEERDKIRQSLGFEKDDFVVIFCGRILKIKGVKELMQSVCEIEDKRVKLLIIGSPNFSRIENTSYLSDVEKLTTNNKDKIVFSGYIENSGLYKYYQSADLQVVPSTYNDPAPLVVIEGLKSGLPQICTISGGIPEYVSKDGCILIPIEKIDKLSKSIKFLSEKSELCAKMGKANIEQAKNFTCEKFYNDFISIIGE